MHGEMKNRKERHDSCERARGKAQGGHIGAEKGGLRDELTRPRNLHLGEVHPGDLQALGEFLGDRNPTPTAQIEDRVTGWQQGCQGIKPAEVATARLIESPR